VTRALDLVGQALVIDPDDSGVLYNVACVYANAGRSEEALSCLERAIHNGFGHLEWLEHDSDFDSVRSDPRFGAFLARRK
jgi:adenylate cyclase